MKMWLFSTVCKGSILISQYHTVDHVDWYLEEEKNNALDFEKKKITFKFTIPTQLLSYLIFKSL